MDRTQFKTIGRILAVVAVSALMVSALVAGGRGKGGATNATGSEQCTITPVPVRNGAEAFTVNGTGFKPGIRVDVQIGGGILMTAADWEGKFAASRWAQFTQVGSYTANCVDVASKKNTILATCSFQVVAP